MGQATPEKVPTLNSFYFHSFTQPRDNPLAKSQSLQAPPPVFSAANSQIGALDEPDVLAPATATGDADDAADEGDEGDANAVDTSVRAESVDAAVNDQAAESAPVNPFIEPVVAAVFEQPVVSTPHAGAAIDAAPPVIQTPAVSTPATPVAVTPIPHVPAKKRECSRWVCWHSHRAAADAVKPNTNPSVSPKSNAKPSKKEGKKEGKPKASPASTPCAAHPIGHRC